MPVAPVQTEAVDAVNAEIVVGGSVSKIVTLTVSVQFKPSFTTKVYVPAITAFWMELSS